METPDWNETKSILVEIEQLFARDDDVRDIVDVNKMTREIEIQRNHHVKEFKELIKHYTNKVASKEKDILAPSAAIHNKKLEKIATEKENLVTSINECHAVIDEKVSEISKLASTALEMQEQMSELEVDEALTQSRTSHALSLYSKVSNISWDYSAPPGVLAGFHGNDDTKEVSRFGFDMTSTDSFEMANALWDVIGEGVPLIT